ncbi:MAG: DUF342 domain-containing protein [Lachnospiraceae bacterium]|nr:DUF342 domain-containing protein [Lachnospiraceae bacterium]
MFSKDDGKPNLRITQDGMEAYLILPIPETDVEYTREEIALLLETRGGVKGIKEDKLELARKDKIYNREILIAEGKEPVDGSDGWYEYKFQREFNRRPEILPDGSANYFQMQLLATVNEGDVIAVYHPAIQGEDGYTVKGAPRNARRTRDLPPLKGKGFERSPEGLSYFSSMDGRVEVRGDKITVSQVYEIPGDVDIAIGNIDFRGDVIIHGSVRLGLHVHAGGSLIIDGIVEAGVNLSADKDILLKSGMMGDSRASVVTKANLFCKFIEYAQVTVGGSIQAEALLSCDVECGDRIILIGKKGRILGGRVRAVRGIEANSIGNQREVATIAAAGVESDVYRRLKLLEHKQEVTRKKLQMIEDEIIEYEKKFRALHMAPKENDMTKMNLIRAKIKEFAMLSQDQIELEELTELSERAKEAKIKVYSTIYPGVIIMIDDFILSIKELQENVYFEMFLDRIIMKRNEE